MHSETRGTPLPHGVILGKKAASNSLLAKMICQPIQADASPHSVLLLGPTRSGKSVSTVIPTAFSWQGSLFVLDTKGEVSYLTRNYRENTLGQRILCFNPVSRENDTVTWNPLAEVHLGSVDELTDVRTIVDCLQPDPGDSPDAYWHSCSRLLLEGAILHLLYLHRKENRPVPSLGDVYLFLASADMDAMMHALLNFAHITPAEFLERADHIQNPLKEAYGEYVMDMEPFRQELGEVHTLGDIRDLLGMRIVDRGEKICWEATEENGLPSGYPFHILLTHPRSFQAGNMLFYFDDRQRQKVIQMAMAALAPFFLPLVRRNTSSSSFHVADLLEPDAPASCYFTLTGACFLHAPIMPRLFLAMLLRDAMRKAEELHGKEEEPKFLLLLDDFASLGLVPGLREAMKTLPGSGTKLVFTALDAQQIARVYGSFSAFAAPCGSRVYYKPNTMPDRSMAKIIAQDIQSAGGDRRKLKPKDILLMPSDEVIVVQKDRVDTCQKIWYFKDDGGYFPFFVTDLPHASTQNFPGCKNTRKRNIPFPLC